MNTPRETVVSEVSESAMKTRLLTATVGIPLALVIVFLSVYVPPVMYASLFALCMIGIYEALKTAGAKKAPVVFAPCFVYGALVMTAPFVGDTVRMCGLILAASMVYLFVMFAILLRKHTVLRIEALCTSMILTMFVAFPFMVVELIFGTIMRRPDGSPSYAGGVALVAYCLTVAWVADGGAYFVGRELGKHKLAPVISPKKTIEGSVGGFVSSLLLSLGAAYVYADVLEYVQSGMNYINLTIITAVCVVMSMFGDLSFSAVKRQYDIKDFGSLLPGHGGVLDRFDSVLFVAPTFYLLQFVLPILR